jgi:hypothetical protein
MLMSIVKSLTSYSIISGKRFEFEESNLRADPGGGTDSLRCWPGRCVDQISILSLNACTSLDSKRSSAISSSYLKT